MSSQHRDPPLNVRPANADRLAAAAVLKANGKDMTGFVGACLRAIVANPKGFLAALDKYWPEKRERGRPPKRP